MKLFATLAGLVLGQNLDDLFTTTLASIIPTSTLPATTLAPKVSHNDRCLKNPWNALNGPAPSTGDFCPKYDCESCCDDTKASSEFAKFFNQDGKLIQHGPYKFSGCGAGHISSKCQASLKNNFCLSSCSPNTYPWAVDNNRRINSMQVCEPFCADFLATCGDEQICYNPEGLVEYLTDVIMGTVDNNKGYEIFECNTNSTCLAVRDTPIANGFDPNNIASAPLKAKYVTYLEDNPFDKSGRFCERFSFNMYSQAVKDADCVDPRDENTVIAYVSEIQENYNEKNPMDKRVFETSPPCPTGLSVGAIVGIVIGTLAGLALIGGLVYYFAFANKSETYAPGKQSDSDDESQVRVQSVKQKAKSVEENEPSIVTSQVDYTPPPSVTS